VLIAGFIMEVTVVETGDLPASTVISFHTGSIRRHAQVEKDKAINLSYVTGSEPIRVDLMSQIGSHTFDMVPGQDVYEVPINSPEATTNDVKLKFQIRDATTAAAAKAREKSAGDDASGQTPAAGEGGQFDPQSPVSPSRKLQTALLMRSYLDNHDVLRQMQELLQDMVTNRPEDPIDYMIQRLEEVCQDTQDVDLDLIDQNSSKIMMADEPANKLDTIAAELPAADAPRTPSKEAPEERKESKGEESEEEDDADDEVENLPPPPPMKKRQSVSAEAYGAFNQRQVATKKVIAKDDSAKQRIRDVLSQSWMFNSHDSSNIDIIVDAMEEKIIEKDVRIINQGDDGNVMWIIEEGTLECSKLIDGVEKVVKTCARGDIFGELALLYNCPRAASVSSRDRCVLWELDRDTFRQVCEDAARGTGGQAYEGFTAPGTASASAPAEEPKTEAKDDGDGDSGGESEGEAPEPVADLKPQQKGGGKPRRQGVSAEAMQEDGTEYVPPVYEKSVEERTQLANIIKTSHDAKLHMLFGSVNAETFEKILDATFLKTFQIGEHAIEQGAVGDYFYIVKSGNFDIIVQKGEEPPKKVFVAGAGFAFGELALLYNAPRTATITAATEGQVFCLERKAFQNLVVKSAKVQFQENVNFLAGVDAFQVLDSNERAALAEVLEEEDFDEDEAIVEQGERDDKMFILRKGIAVACIKGDQGEVEVKQYKQADYFGEIALLSGEPRKASVYAVGACSCLYITRATFLRILGPLKGLLERNISQYEKYQDAIASADPADEMEQKDDDNDEHTGAKDKGKTKISKKRERKEDGPVVKANVKLEKAEDGEPTSLAEKVAIDFKNKALVDPSKEFEIPESKWWLYGGLVLGQKFTMDKFLHCCCEGTPSDIDEIYTWDSPTKLKGATELAVLCQKGQKSASDPTPNQDNFFIHHIGPISMYGIADGHGPFGHLVSFRLVQTLPYYIFKHPDFGVGKDWAEILKVAFLQAQADLEKFCASQDINIEASGAAGSVCVMEEQTIHIAFIGDARIMLGSWNRRDSRMVFCTSDHKPENAGEKERLEAAGSEVREIDGGSYRIYLPGSGFPGLTMSRAFGDTACAGVLREPEYHKYSMQPSDEWYAIVASDGIWEFIEGEEAMTMTAKKLRLKGTRETLAFLVQAARKRWKYCAGDYCDDITAILVQWNSHEKKSGKANHTLTLRKPKL
jgi:cAMP-dependent protein kinase regulator